MSVFMSNYNRVEAGIGGKFYAQCFSSNLVIISLMGPNPKYFFVVFILQRKPSHASVPNPKGSE